MWAGWTMWRRAEQFSDRASLKSEPLIPRDPEDKLYGEGKDLIGITEHDIVLFGTVRYGIV